MLNKNNVMVCSRVP